MDSDWDKGSEKGPGKSDSPCGSAGGRPVRVGAVSFLNARPLIYRLAELAPQAELVMDVPSRLADSLACGRLDVALIPSIEYFRSGRYAIVPQIAIAAHGPVWSVRLYCRRPVRQVRSVALDEGSRASVALVKVLFAKHWGVWPEWRPLPLGLPAAEADADAVLLIGDRAMSEPLEGAVEWYDLGEVWLELTGLPFVFAMWVTDRSADLGGLDRALLAARDAGLAAVDQIAAESARRLGISVADAVRYLTQHIHYELGERELEGLRLFRRWAAELELIATEVSLVFYRGSNLATVR
jgi:chorismate dehydratase